MKLALFILAGFAFWMFEIIGIDSFPKTHKTVNIIIALGIIGKALHAW